MIRCKVCECRCNENDLKEIPLATLKGKKVWICVWCIIDLKQEIA